MGNRKDIFTGLSYRKREEGDITLPPNIVSVRSFAESYGYQLKDANKWMRWHGFPCHEQTEYPGAYIIDSVEKAELFLIWYQFDCDKHERPRQLFPSDYEPPENVSKPMTQGQEHYRVWQKKIRDGEREKREQEKFGHLGGRPETLREFATRLGYHPTTSYTWRKAGFPCEEIDGVFYVIDQQKAQEFLEWYNINHKRGRRCRSDYSDEN